MGDSVVTLDCVGAVGPDGLTLLVGQRVPFHAPLGSIFAAWSDERVQRQWLDQGNFIPESPEAQHCVELLGTIRKRGYAVGLESPHLTSSIRREPETPAVGGTTLVEGLLERQVSLPSLHDDERYSVRHISAPVFDMDSAAALAVGVFFFGLPLTGLEINDMATSVVRGAAQITHATRGVAPRDFPWPADS